MIMTNNVKNNKYCSKDNFLYVRVNVFDHILFFVSEKNVNSLDFYFLFLALILFCRVYLSVI